MSQPANQAGIAADLSARAPVPVAFDQAVSRIVDVLALTPTLTYQDWRAAFDRQFEDQYPGLWEAHGTRECQWAATLHGERRDGTSDMYFIVSGGSITPEARQFIVTRLEPRELRATLVHLLQSVRDWPHLEQRLQPLADSLRSALRESMTPEEIAAHRETQQVGQSNVSQILFSRLVPDAAMSALAFAGSSIEDYPARQLHPLQQARMTIDTCRRIRDKERHPTQPMSAYQREQYKERWDEFAENVAKSLHDLRIKHGVLDAVLGYLTAAELTATGKYVERVRWTHGNVWRTQVAFARRVAEAVDELRDERANAEQSGLLFSPRRNTETGGLLPPWAHRDSDAMHYLSTWLSRSVVLRQPQTLFRSRMQLAVTSFLALPVDGSHKRKVEGAADENKKQRDDESKEQE